MIGFVWEFRACLLPRLTKREHHIQRTRVSGDETAPENRIQRGAPTPKGTCYTPLRTPNRQETLTPTTSNTHTRRIHYFIQPSI
jgi:hypothetical protein